MDSIIKKVYSEKLYILFNGESSLDHDLILYDIPLIISPVKRYKSYQVGGLDGELIEDEDTRSNGKVECVFSLLGPCTREKVRDIKRWLDTSGELLISDDFQFYFKTIITDFGDVERNLLNFGKFKVIFTVMPYEFAVDGKDWRIQRTNDLYNLHNKAYPRYRITGEGVCTLSVNGNDMSMNIGQNIVLDTYIQEAYKMDGTNQNLAVSGNFTSLALIPGVNEISITDGFVLEIQPNWGMRM